MYMKYIEENDIKTIKTFLNRIENGEEYQENFEKVKYIDIQIQNYNTTNISKQKPKSTEKVKYTN